MCLTMLIMMFGYLWIWFMSEGVDLVLRDGLWMIRGILIFLNKWSPSLSLLKEELSRVSVWVKFHDVPLVAYTSNGLSLTAMKIDTPMIDNLVMVVPNLESTGYTKETIHIEYEWEPPRCNTCMIFGHSPDECPKAAPKRVEYRPKAKQSTACMASPAGTNKASNKESLSIKGNGSFSISNSFEVLNVDNLFIKEVATGCKVTNSDCSAEVNAASENMFEVTTASEYQVNAAS
ncbi:zinc knuckle CX2CX4HX4C containing protein [Tanacetum coccineum]